MTFTFRRRALLQAAIPATFVTAGLARADQAVLPARLAQLEASIGGRLGVCALHTGTGAQIRHRADERFPMCSTFKAMLAGAILHRDAQQPGLLQQRVRYTRSDLISWSPVTEKHLENGMTVAELCAATVQYSDNAAANLLLKLLDGPAGLTTVIRTIGDNVFRLDRWELDLNTALPGDERDTTTPAAMMSSLNALALGTALPAAQRTQFQTWLRGNTTGAARIQAGVPTSWQVGDKTGTGAYGTTNDIGVIWPATGAPIVLALYLTQPAPNARPNDACLAEATRIVMQALG